MKNRQLLVGVLILAVLAWLAVLTRKPAGNKSFDSTPADGVLLDFDINQAVRLEVVSNAETVTVYRKEGRWVAADFFDYPANFDTVSDWVLRFARLRAGPVIRDGSKELEAFGLAQDGPVTATRVAFYDEQNNTLAQLDIGKSRTTPGGQGRFPGGTDGTYVRIGDGEVLLVDEHLASLPKEPGGWTSRELTRIAPADIRTIKVNKKGGEPYELRRDESGTYTLPGLSDDQEIDATAANRLGRSLQYLSFVHVADPSKTDEELGLVEPDVLEVQTGDLLVYSVMLGADTGANNRYARLSATYQEPPAPDKPVEGESTEEDQQAYQEALDQHAKEVTAGNEKVAAETGKFEAWTFVLQKHQCDDMLLPREGLIKQVEKEPASEGTAQESQGGE